jgi:hypothetical protein
MSLKDGLQKKLSLSTQNRWTLALAIPFFLLLIGLGYLWIIRTSMSSEIQSEKEISSEIEASLGNYQSPWIPFMTGRILADGTEESLMGFIDIEGKIQLSAQWDELLLPEGDKARARWGDAWGIIDLKGKWLILPRYKSIGPMIEGFRTFEFGDSSGWLTPHNKTLTSSNFEKVTHFQNSKAGASLAGRWGFVDTWGNWHSPKQNLGGLIPLGQKQDQALWAFKKYKDSLWGWMDASENVLLLPSLDSLEALDPIGDSVIYIKAQKQGLWGIMNAQGTWILPAQFQNILAVDGKTWAVQQHDLWTFWPRATKTKMPQFWSLGPCQKPRSRHQINHLTEILCVGQNQEGAGLVNAQGKWILPPKYGVIDSLGNGWWRTWQAGQEARNAWDWIWTLWHPVDIQATSLLTGSLQGSPPSPINPAKIAEEDVADSSTMGAEAPDIQGNKDPKSIQAEQNPKTRKSGSPKPWHNQGQPFPRQIEREIPWADAADQETENGFYSE